MTAAAEVSVIWLAPPREDSKAALESWMRAKGLRPRQEDVLHASPSPIAVDLSVAEQVELELEQSREAMADANAEATERALTQSDALLRNHPQLPQAAWLLAEVKRGWASRFDRLVPRDDTRAQAAWQDAAALDGGRVAGIGETQYTSRPTVSARIAVTGILRRSTIARLDGTPLTATRREDGTTSYEVDVSPAEHQLTFSNSGVTVSASWLTIPPRTRGEPERTFSISLDEIDCSPAALAEVAAADGTIQASGVTCDAWVAASPSPTRGSVQLARCTAETCGPIVEWRTEVATSRGPTTVTPPPRGWQGWMTWTAVGVGGLAATTVTLIALGLFESRSSATETRFTTGGVRIE